MGKQRFPGWFGAPDQAILTAKVTGASVGATAGSDGLDDRGKWNMTISKSTHAITIVFLEAYAQAPIPIFTWLTDNVAAKSLTVTTTGMTFSTVQRSDDTTGVNDANYWITLLTDRSNKAYS